MRKVTLLIGALALVLGISQCNKQDSPLQNGGKQHIVLTTGNDGSKVAVTTPTSVLNFTWEAGDVITVSDGATGTLHLTSEPGQSTATFEGDVEGVTGEPLVFSVGTKPTPETYMNQSGTIDALKGILYFETEKAYQENGNYGNVELPLTFAVLNIDLSGFASSKSGGATVTFSEKDTRGEPIASVTGVTALSTAVLVALPTDASPQEKVYELSNGTVVDYMTCTLNPDVYYSGNDEGNPIQPDPEPIVPGGGELTPPDGALPGLFSIGEGKKVFFSKGNLYADISDDYGYLDGDDPWHFEDKQYYYRDYYGIHNNEEDGVYANLAGGTETPEHTVGMFYWSPNIATACSKAWNSESSDAADIFFTNTDDVVLNGNSAWYTLSTTEWEWLLGPGAMASIFEDPIPGKNCRKSSKVGVVDNARFAWVSVNGVPGMLIFPDEFTWNKETMGEVPDDENINNCSNFTAYSYSDANFTAMENAGCAFLPAAGYRNATPSVSGLRGLYWSTSFMMGYASFPSYIEFAFDGSNHILQTESAGSRSNSCPVRLVIDAE